MPDFGGIFFMFLIVMQIRALERNSSTGLGGVLLIILSDILILLRPGPTVRKNGDVTAVSFGYLQQVLSMSQFFYPPCLNSVRKYLCWMMMNSNQTLHACPEAAAAGSQWHVTIYGGGPFKTVLLLVVCWAWALVMWSRKKYNWSIFWWSSSRGGWCAAILLVEYDIK